MTDYQYEMVHFNKIFLMVVFISAYANSGGGGEGIPVPPSVCNPDYVEASVMIQSNTRGSF